MSVAEKTPVAAPPRSPHQQILLGSVPRALYVLGSFFLVYMGLPLLWRVLRFSELSNEFLADALLILVTLPTILGLVVLGLRLESGREHPGTRAGAAFICLGLVLGGLLLFGGSALWSVVGIVVLVGAGVLLFQPAFTAWLVRVENAGWFRVAMFKPNQGLRVRWSTFFAIMILVVCGLYTMYNRGSLRTGTRLIQVGSSVEAATDPWIGYLPFSDPNNVHSQFVLLWLCSINVLMLLFAGGAWVAWRVVNWPAFADFLIATEAEMNKVSWTTRKRLYQDTIVVLVTVVLFTLFLFVVDILWIKILTNPVIDVLKHDPAEAARKNQAGAQW
jgi:preprotein translocase SecE subunit